MGSLLSNFVNKLKQNSETNPFQREESSDDSAELNLTSDECYSEQSGQSIKENTQIKVNDCNLNLSDLWIPELQDGVKQLQVSAKFASND